ncbi:fatty acid hydroxylase superfamily-domain-containing protein [Thelonectria olida]|uniref:Fatty acid hydroxylase superfamily-domain-containing protein n=1 Tax=Thelonectria olida TaxID=1576542 RepID=A0A9P9ALZ6_9HYPO|nr:fatty acid hydroxylase superfamily-domain-containing protein [Thelonectria olida]
MAETWNHIVLNYSPYTIEIVGSFIVQLIFWWIPSVIYISLDTIAPSFAEKHKIQPAPKQPTAAQVWEAVVVSIRNQALVLALQTGLSLVSLSQGQPSTFQITTSPPSAADFLRDFILSLIGREILFYYSHRLFHVPYLYRRIHKTHHKFKAPVSFASQYAHPVEHIVANMLPIALPPALLHTHIFTMWAFLAWQLIETATVHSGYDFFGGAARRHDRHHERFDVEFGGMAWLDWFHGTDEKGAAEKRKMN